MSSPLLSSQLLLGGNVLLIRLVLGLQTTPSNCEVWGSKGASPVRRAVRPLPPPWGWEGTPSTVDTAVPVPSPSASPEGQGTGFPREVV